MKDDARDAVLLTITVTDSDGHFVSDLGRDNFVLSEGKAQREITYFNDKSAPMSVAFLLDKSGSMTPKRANLAKLAVERFVQLSQPGTEYFIGEFSNGVRALTDWTSDPQQLLDGLRRSDEEKPKGNTALYDACSFALDALVRAQHPKRVLLVVTDGQDNISHMEFNELRRRVRATDVLIYAIGIVERGNPGSLDAGGQAILDELAAQSGGRAFFPTGNKEAVEVADWIAAELRHQYVIGFAPGDEAAADKSKWRKVSVKVISSNKKLKGVTARSREGYFSSPRPTS